MNGAVAYYAAGVEVLDALVDHLQQRGYEVVAPTVRDDAICVDVIAGAGELPVGWADVQEPGRYSLARRGDEARFGHAVGPHAWKRYLFPPERLLWRARQDPEAGLVFEVPREVPPRYAFLGVRACDLRAVAIQGEVFTGGAYVDRDYLARRRRTFVVAVECGAPAQTCFCDAMGAGPEARDGFDLALTELIGPRDGRHRILLRAGSAIGRDLLEALPTEGEASAEDLADRADLLQAASLAMKRTVPVGVEELLQRNLKHPQWADIAQRCLGCGNCTQVCPTCFCSTVEDVTELMPDAGDDRAARVRRWDSCFSSDHSHLHGGSSRASIQARYRQWLTHKLSTWRDQFGTAGCTGCGRCIVWCPAGIDLTAEVAAIAESDGARGSGPSTVRKRRTSDHALQHEPDPDGEAS